MNFSWGIAVPRVLRISSPSRASDFLFEAEKGVFQQSRPTAAVRLRRTIYLKAATSRNIVESTCNIWEILGRIQSSRRLEHEEHRDLELMWLTGRFAPDFKIITDFTRTTVAPFGPCAASSSCCADLFTQAPVAVDGSAFKAGNNRDKNFTAAKLKRRLAENDASIARHLAALDSVDRVEPEVAPQGKIAALKVGDRMMM